MRNSAIFRCLGVLCLVLAGAQEVLAQLEAFPGAEGFGRYTTGARTNLASASVYHVTNLNDSGPGSFRDAVSQSNRFVVFDVGGIIDLDSVVSVASNVTIAGQTAPGGIALWDHRISFTGSDNLISRHFAVRMGTSPGREDAASIAQGQDMIFDHMSITWGVDGTFDINADEGYVIDNITIQDSIIAQGLDNVGHSTGGLMQPGNGGKVSVIKSLYADNVTRNPKVRENNEFINNVVYGWGEPSGGGAGYIMGGTAGTSNANVVGNYFIEGPLDGSHPFSSGTSTFHIYEDDNWVDTNRNGVLDGSVITSYPGADVVATPHSFPTTASLTAQQAVTHVMENAGPNIIRDAVDTQLMNEVASYGTLGGVIERPSDLYPGYGTDSSYLNPRARIVDNDNDGIADNWEDSKGLDSNNANDWKGLSPAGYTWLEEYVNELGAQGTTRNSSGGDWTTPATWGGTVPTLADDALATGNLNHTSGQAFARRLTIDGSLAVSGGSVDVFDTATIDGLVLVTNGDLMAGRMKVASPGQNESVIVYSGSTLRTGSIATNGGTATLNLVGGTFQATGDIDISIPTTLGTGGGTLDTNGYSGNISQAISGTGSLTKQGEGTLRLEQASTFTGPLHLQGGTIELASGATLNNTSQIELDAETTLDASALSGGMTLNNGQTLTGKGTVIGNLNAGAGSVVRPFGEVTGAVHTIGIQAENMALGSDWEVFNNAVHGTGNGGSYDGAGLFGGGIVLVDGESLSAPSGADGVASTLIDVPESGPWYLFARTAEPSNSGVTGDPSLTEGGNNSFWISGLSSIVQATPTTSDIVQTPGSAAPNSAKWVKVSPTLPALSGIWTAEDDGIDYDLTAGLQYFSTYGREIGTIIDGFVLTTANLDTYQLDTALQGSSGFTLGNTFTIEGNYTQAAGASLAIEIGDAISYNKLDVTGTASLGGMLEVSLVDLGGGIYQPTAGDEFEILSAAGGFTGTFDGGLNLPALNGFLTWNVNYDTLTDRVLLEVSTPFAADFDGDGDVDHNDLATWQSSFGSGTAGDTNGDNITNGFDYFTWIREFTGDLTVASLATATVPEPSSLLLLLLGLTTWANRRR